MDQFIAEDEGGDGAAARNIPTPDELKRRALALLPEIRERAARCEAERRIPDELQPLVVRNLVVVPVRPVGQCFLQQFDVPEAVPEAAGELDDRAVRGRRRAAPSPARHLSPPVPGPSSGRPRGPRRR